MAVKVVAQVWGLYKSFGVFTRHFGVLKTPLVHFFTGPHWRLLRRDGRRRVSIKIIAVVERV